MDFFEAQDAARKRTGLLVALFGAAVVGIIAVVYAALHLGTGRAALDPVLLLQVALGVGLVIAAGSAIRIAGLRQGGSAVATLLGGRAVDPATADPMERRLLNVVEEMAVASGMPVPGVYVLDREDGINAFAAGHALDDAVVAVTRGALLGLTRDELQGVVAHEFSHILNGDMRLNIRLMGVLYGILLLGVIGRGIVQVGPRAGRGRNRDNGAGWIVLVGLALLVVGYVGVFFGKLIKAAVSRQREFLADSAAVQFTRNPAGLAGALQKIGAAAHGSRIRDHRAEEASHLFFANGLSRSIAGFLSTHPPLEARIRRLDPAWSGDFADVPRPSAAAVEARSSAGGAASAARPLAPTAAAAAVAATVGTPTVAHLTHATRLLEALPDRLTRAAHDPVDARALVMALVAAGQGDHPAARAAIHAAGGSGMAERVAELAPLVRTQAPEARLTLLEIALPSLQRMAPAEAQRFRTAVEQAVRADGSIRTFEFALLHSLARRLPGAPAPTNRRGHRHRSVDAVHGEAEVLLSAVAWAGAPGEDAASAAFRAGVRRLPSLSPPLALREPAALDLAAVDDALTRLEDASPAVRRALIEACAEAAAHDGHLHAREAELLRAISECLDSPMPPILAAEPSDASPAGAPR